MKDEILVLMKNKIRQISEEIDYSNYRRIEEEMYRIFTIIESAEGFQLIKGETIPLVLENAVVESRKEPVIKKKEVAKKKSYLFQRRIRGGVLFDLDAFVPEKVVTDLQVKNGDRLYADLKKEMADGPNHYEYSVAEKGNPDDVPSDNIVSVEMGVVSYDVENDQYYVDKTFDLTGDSDNSNFPSLILSKDDVSTFTINEGDIVNLAYYQGSEDFVKVRWKHFIGESNSASAPKPSSYYKKKDGTHKEDIPQYFEGKTIAALGFEPGHPAYREEVVKRGGTFIGLTGKEEESILKAAIRKSDCLIMILVHVGHVGTTRAVPICKELNVPHENISTFGRNVFVNTAIDLLSES